MACDVGRIVGSEKADRAGYVLGRTYAAERNLLHGTLLEFFAEHSGHAGLDESWSDRIASDIARRHFARHRHGQPDQPGFRGRVVRLSRLPDLSEDAGDVDDPSPALLEHRADYLLDAQVCRS